MYTLQMAYTDGSSKRERTAQFVKSIANYFDENGYICTELFDPEVCRLHDGLSSEKKQK